MRSGFIYGLDDEAEQYQSRIQNTTDAQGMPGIEVV
jgi:hypothetical protein